MWKKLRIPFLVLTCGCVLITSVNALLLASKANNKKNTFQFSDQVFLTGWQLTASRPLPKPQVRFTELITQHYYQFTQNNLSLEIKMRYTSDGNIPLYLKKTTEISPSATNTIVIRKREGIGYYGLGTDKKRTFLSSCITARKGSTFTYEQFNQNSYQYQTNPQNILSWLLGKENIQDRRCFWVYLSMPLQNSSPEANYLTLEKAWFSWYEWWQSRFPKI
jgi:cyanosortase A-associated protein